MKSSTTGRVLAVLFLGVLRGVYSHYSEMKWLGQGRDAFLADQAHRFDRITAYHSAATMLVAGLIQVVVAVALYEVIAAMTTRILPASRLEQ